MNPLVNLVLVQLLLDHFAEMGRNPSPREDGASVFRKQTLVLNRGFGFCMISWHTSTSIVDSINVNSTRY